MTNTPTPNNPARRRQGKKLNQIERAAAQEKFLEAFANSANIRASCGAAGIDRSTVYQWQDSDPDFAARFDKANEDANDMIRAEYIRRAVRGIDEPIVSAGRIVYQSDGSPLTVKKYSDSLLSSLARVRLPEFKEKPAEQPQETASGIGADVLPYLDRAQLDRLATLQAEEEAILDEARAKKLEAEQGIMSINKHNRKIG